MPVRKYTQPGVFSVIVILSALIFMIIMLFVVGFEEPVPMLVISFMMLIFIVCLLIFYRMTIIIDDTTITFIMGIGLIRKSYHLSEIESCRAVRNKAWWGIGIRLTPSGWLYNVSGMYAIELKFRGTGKKVRIGTDKPEEIAKVVNKMTDGKSEGVSFEAGGNGGLYLILALLAATIIVPVIMIIYGTRETDVSFSDSEMTLSGMYGMTIGYEEIISADTVLTMPAIRSRTNGFASGRILKGHFRLDDRSKVMLFINKGVPPFISLKTNDQTLYLNFPDPLRTREVFRSIRVRMR